MLYSILIYGDELALQSIDNELSKSHLAKHKALQQQLLENNQLRPVAKLMPTTTAVTISATDGDDVIVTDGPFAEIKEQLLGFYTVEAPSLESAISIASKLPLGQGASIEIRPIEWFTEGNPLDGS